MNSAGAWRLEEGGVHDLHPAILPGRMRILRSALTKAMPAGLRAGVATNDSR
jgi:hypothetical protein